DGYSTPENHVERIKIAYLSSDFCQHPVGYLTARLFELHDRARFETIGISHGPDDGSDLRTRLASAFDQFYDAREMSDRTVAELMRGLGTHIAVDLNGHTTGSRLGILSMRAAPIQVNFLGFAGTIGADFLDYVIADRIVAPMDQQDFYSEKIVH